MIRVHTPSCRRGFFSCCSLLAMALSKQEWSSKILECYQEAFIPFATLFQDGPSLLGKEPDEEFITLFFNYKIAAMVTSMTGHYEVGFTVGMGQQIPGDVFQGLPFKIIFSTKPLEYVSGWDFIWHMTVAQGGHQPDVEHTLFFQAKRLDSKTKVFHFSHGDPPGAQLIALGKCYVARHNEVIEKKLRIVVHAGYILYGDHGEVWIASLDEMQNLKAGSDADLTNHFKEDKFLLQNTLPDMLARQP